MLTVSTTIPVVVLAVIEDPGGRPLPHVRLAQEAADTLSAWKAATWREVPGVGHGETRPAGPEAARVLDRVADVLTGRPDHEPHHSGSFHAVLMDPADHVVHATYVHRDPVHGWSLHG